MVCIARPVIGSSRIAEDDVDTCGVSTRRFGQDCAKASSTTRARRRDQAHDGIVVIDLPSGNVADHVHSARRIRRELVDKRRGVWPT